MLVLTSAGFFFPRVVAGTPLELPWGMPGGVCNQLHHLDGNMLLVLFYFYTLSFIFVFKRLIYCPYQVSTSSSVVEEREVVYTSSQPDSSVQWDPLAGEAMEAKEEVMDEAGEPLKPVTVRFVLEESSGYMEPMLRILAVLHTVISFFCIIGYYCLKVGYLLICS